MDATNARSAPIEIPEPSGVLAEPWSAGKLWRLAALFGPAAIVASVSIGAGETIIVVKTGSWAGYNLLWLVLASALVKGVCVTYLLGRYSAVSGEMIGHRLVRLPGPRGWLLIAIIALELAAAGPLWAAIARPSGDLLYYLLDRAASLTGLGGGSPMNPSLPADQLFGISAATWHSLFATLLICGGARAGRRRFVRLARAAASDHLRHSGGRHDCSARSWCSPTFSPPSWACLSVRLHAADSRLGAARRAPAANSDDDDDVWLRRRLGDVLYRLRQLGVQTSLGTVQPSRHRSDSPRAPPPAARAITFPTTRARPSDCDGSSRRCDGTLRWAPSCCLS